jgi:hypothetical protein
MGFREGPLIGQLLRRVREEQLDGTLTSEAEALELVRQLVEEGKAGERR